MQASQHCCNTSTFTSPCTYTSRVYIPLPFHDSIPLPITLSAGTQALTAQQTYLGGTCVTPSAGQCVQAPLSSHTEPWPALSSWGRGGSPATPSARPSAAQTQLGSGGEYHPAWSQALPARDLAYTSWSLPPAQRGGWGG